MTTQHLSFISLRIVRMFLLMVTCLMLASCDETPQELLSFIQRGGANQSAAIENLLEMQEADNPGAGKAQEEAGYFFELKNYELAEKFWQAARKNGRSNARPSSPQKLLVIIKAGGAEQAAAINLLLKMTEPGAGEAQEEAGYFFELKNYELAEKFWLTARKNGRSNARAKYSSLWRFVYNHPIWCLFTIIGILSIICMSISSMSKISHEQKEREDRQREQIERQKEQERKHIEYLQEQEHKKLEAQQQVLQSAWWNLPNDSILLFDTCVLMTDEIPGLDDWLYWIVVNAEHKQWKIHIIKDVYEEIKKHKSSGTEEERFGARQAMRRIEAMQKMAETYVEVGCEGKRKDFIYADDPLLAYISHNENAILFTKDRDLGIRAQNARRGSQLRIHDDFKPYPGSLLN